ncbi:MAG: hypothetical protein ABL886_03610 [Rhodoglobus sp.]
MRDLDPMNALHTSSPGPDRVFFGLAGAWFVVLTFVGFAPSFFLRADPEPLPVHLVVHGVVYSAWVVLFLVQVLLIARGRARWHATLGIASLVLLLLMIPVGFHVVLVKAASGDKGADEAGFNLAQLSLGFVFAFTGIALRRRPHVHKRLMLFATTMLTVAAADRVAALLALDDVRLFRKALAVVPVLALVARDAWIRRRMLVLDVASLAVMWLVLWFVVSDILFLRPAGEAVLRRLSAIFVG